MIAIKPFSTAHREAIKTLNYEWLQKYFEVEPIDEKVLSNPECEIIDKGGFIYYAWENDQIIGTASLIKINNTTFELTKMAVTESHQGKRIGHLLMEHALEEARKMNATKVLLYSNTLLEKAITMYHRFGFVACDFDSSSYKRANIMMEKYL